MRAIILSAGMGTRVGNLTSTKPKCLLDIHGTNILEIQVNQFKKIGIEDIIVIGGHYAHKIINPSITLIENQSYETTNMFFSLMCAKEYFSDDIIISYGDIIYYIDILKSLVEDARNDIVVADINWKEYWLERFGNTECDLESFQMIDGYISEIGKKVKNSSRIDARYVGLMKFSKETLKYMTDYYDYNIMSQISSKIKMMYLTDIIQYLISKKNLKISVHEIIRGWCEIDTAKDYLFAEKFFKNNQHLIIDYDNT